MNYEVEWTEYAYEDFERIGEWLFKKWGKKSVRNFEREVDIIITLLVKRPTSFQISQMNPTFRKTLINKHTSLFFRIDGNLVTIITLWDHARNPQTLKDLLDRTDDG